MCFSIIQDLMHHKEPLLMRQWKTLSKIQMFRLQAQKCPKFTALEFNDRKIVEANIDPGILQVTSKPDNEGTNSCTFLLLDIVNQLTKNKSEDYKSLAESVIIDFSKKFNIYRDKKECWLMYTKHITSSQKMACMIYLSRFSKFDRQWPDIQHPV